MGFESNKAREQDKLHLVVLATNRHLSILVLSLLFLACECPIATARRPESILGTLKQKTAYLFESDGGQIGTVCR